MSAPPFETAATARDPTWDLAQLVAYVSQADVRTVRGGRLALADVRAIAARFDPAAPTAGARAECAVPRVRFIHYAAAALGLVTYTGKRIMPAPGALAWFERPAPERWRAVWEAWLDRSAANAERWAAFGLAGAPARALDSMQTVARMLERLVRFEPRAWHETAALAGPSGSASDESAEWWEVDARPAGPSLVWDLLQGPLGALGAVETWDAPAVGATDDSEAIDGPGAHDVCVDRAGMGMGMGISDTAGLCLARFRVTPRGAWLVGRADGEPPPDDVPAGLYRDFVVPFPLGTAPAPLVALADCGSWDAETRGLVFTRASLRRALGRRAVDADVFAQDFAARLQRYVQPRLGRADRRRLEAWIVEAPVVRLRDKTVLEVGDDRVRRRLISDRGVRAHLGLRRWPSSGVMAVRSADVKALARRLTKLGIVVQWEGRDDRGDAGGVARPGDIWTATALLVLERLAERHAVGSSPPPAALARHRASVDGATWAAAEAAAADVMARLTEVLDGPSPVPATFGEAAALEVVEAAIDAGDDVWLRYWSAWRGETTERRVTPAYVEWQGDLGYVVGHCHLRRAERHFRLDRVLEVWTAPAMNERTADVPAVDSTGHDVTGSDAVGSDAAESNAAGYDG